VLWVRLSFSLSVLAPIERCQCRFTYTDTLKVLEKWGPGCHFLGFGVDSDIDELEKILEAESTRDPTKPPVLALFTEFPSNPLLRSANLPRLRVLADKYDFLIVIDETIGNFVNVEVLPYADILVSSLTKVFSGASNVMGGRSVDNPCPNRIFDTDFCLSVLFSTRKDDTIRC
jgi:cystathionine gamma-synthase